jgi:cobalamin biosynthesis Mg chelatase CobN
MPSASTAPVSTHGASAQAVPTPVSSRRAASVHATVRASPVHGTPAGNRAPAPAIPSFNAAPLGAPRPSTPSQPPAFDPARSAIVQREFELRASASARTAGAATYAETPRTLAVILVVLVAAAAAISVYFVLPLLT